MAKSRFFIISSLIFLFTSFVLVVLGDDSLAELLGQYKIFAAILAIIFLFSTFVWRNFFILFLICLSLLSWQSYYAKHRSDSFTFDVKYNFEAKVSKSEAEIAGRRLILSDHGLDLPGGILAKSRQYPAFLGGERVNVSCTLRRPEPISTDEGDFAYDKYLLMNGIVASCSYPQIMLVEGNRSFLHKVRRYMFESLNTNLTEPASSVVKAFILGPQREIPDQVRQEYSHIGLTHILSISGLHMAVIIYILHLILQRVGLGRGGEWIVMSIVLGTYMILIDFIAPAARSAMMAALLLGGPFISRRSSPIYGLILVADIFVLTNPYRVAYDLSFQLSFFAVLGLLLYTKFFSHLFSFITNRFKIREVLAVTMAAQMLTWPLILKTFHNFSIVAPLANFILLPASSLLLVLGLALSFAGQSWVAVVIGWPIIALTYCMDRIVKILAALPYAYITSENFSMFGMITAYAIVFLFTIIVRPYEKN